MTVEYSLLDPRRWLGALSSGGSARGGRGLTVAIYPLLSLLALMQAASSGAVERIASDAAGRVLFAALAGLLLIVALAAVVAVVAYTHEALQPRIGDALLHFSLAVAVACFALAPDQLLARDGALAVGGLGALLFATGVVLLGRSLASRITEASDELQALAGRDALVRGLVCVAVGAFLYAGSVQAAPAPGPDLLARMWGVPLFLSTAAALLVYVWHSAQMMSQALKRSGGY